MLDARNIHRKVTRAIFDFSPEQQQNIAAIVWLYRGQPERFLGLVEEYLAQAVVEGQATAGPLSAFEQALGNLIELAEPFATEGREPDPLAETWAELASAEIAVADDIEAFGAEVAARAANWERSRNSATRDNATLHAARKGLHNLTERCRDLTKQIDLAAKLGSRAVDIAVKELDARKSDDWANADINRARRALEDARIRRRRKRCAGRGTLCSKPIGCRSAFPDAELRDVEGLVKLVDRAELEAHDWSLTPGQLCWRSARRRRTKISISRRRCGQSIRRLGGAERGGGGTGGSNHSKL